ncbi:MAG: hypothetical protein U1C74_26345, partial [Phenylobacterium sp.]|nr:hypothetical protein [Phenylobacterium sp.]
GPTPVGRYVTRDRYFMVGGQIIATAPPATFIDGTYELKKDQTVHDTYTDRLINGGMTDPGRDGGTGINPNLTPNGLDGLPSADGNTEVPFLLSKVTAPELTGVPIVGPATFLKVRSNLADPQPREARSKVASWSVPTILAAGQYPRRGPFARWGGSYDKTPLFYESDIDWSRLVQNRVQPAGVALPTMEYFLTKLGPFQLYFNQWLFARGVTPYELTEHYGAEIVNVFTQAMCAATTIGFPIDDAKFLVRRIMSFGIETEDATTHGRRWSGQFFAFGGAHQCFKLPMIIAAHFLHAAQNQAAVARMVAYCDTAQNRIFGDDIMTFRTERDEIEGSPYQPIQNRIEPIGYPDWAFGSVDWMVQPSSMDAMGFSFEHAYRLINGHPFQMSAYLTRILGKEAAWNNPVFFEYCDRLWDLWKYRGMPANERLTAVPRAYMLENYEALSPNYQDPDPPAPLRFVARGKYVWIEFDKNLTLFNQPAPEDVPVTVAGEAVDLSGVTTTASGVKSTAGSNPVNTNKPVITVGDAAGFRVGQALDCDDLEPDTFVSSVDVPTKTIGISTLIPETFTNRPITTRNVIAYARAMAAVLPDELTSITTPATIGYNRPVGGGIRSLGGVEVPTIAPTACVNETGILPAGPTRIDTVYSGPPGGPRQRSGTRALRSQTFRKARFSVRYMKYATQAAGANIISALSAASTGLRVYHANDNSPRMQMAGQGLRLPNALVGAPIGQLITMHWFLDSTQPSLDAAMKAAVLWAGGGSTDCSKATTTYDSYGKVFNIATMLSQGLYAFSPASGSDPLNGAIREIMIGWGDEDLEIPDDLSGPQFAHDADWGPNGENVWGQNQLYYAGTLDEWNTAVPNRGNYGGLSLSPRLFTDGDPEFGLERLYDLAA